jgi:peptide/nickel transport system substrate-binding protein
VVRAIALLAALAVALLAVSGAGGAATQQTPKRGGTVIFGTSSGAIVEPACMNVLVVKCAAAQPFFLAFTLEEVLEPAFDVGPDFTFRPRLVSRVTVTSRPPFTLTYRIRAEARWSDGVSVTARDFVFTHETRVAHRAALGPEDRAVLGHVRRVTAAGPKTVRVVLRSRFAGWHTLFGNVLPEHVLEGRDLSKTWLDGIDDPRTGEPIGSGPFLLESWKRGREFTLVRNRRYWGSHPAFLDRLVIPFGLGDKTRSAFRKGDVDIAWGVFPPEVPALRREPGLRVTSPPSSNFEPLSIRVGRGGHPALKNRLVRQAIAFGLDRAGLARQLFGAIASTKSLDSVVYLIQSPFYEPNWSRYRPRPALARRLLGQARCRPGADGIYVCAGNRLSLRFITTAGVPPRELVLKSMQVQLRKIGIEVVPTYAAPQTLFSTILPRGTFDVALHGWGFDPNPTQASTLFGCGALYNWTGYCSRSVQRGLDRAARTLDAGAQARILNRVDVQVSRDVPMVPLFQLPLSTALRTSVRNFRTLPLNPLSDAENWWLDD